MPSVLSSESAVMDCAALPSSEASSDAPNSPRLLPRRSNTINPTSAAEMMAIIMVIFSILLPP